MANDTTTKRQIITTCFACKFASGRSFYQCPVCESYETDGLEVMREKILTNNLDERHK